ncbi:MAG: hypothetical protein COV31_01955 [Candidatus Yanofskybacteria bacterium CG10_big_fil_rev_8_21_14_0_10_46_23]|uniref:Uncharacterized protein n=1 Tax=Candidatus Yanofskybacteria bacterium CG10_big_fil_rev_8_21_14_0_10_46_23 TaxID=1975098 RepID=A0A2H0R4C4_9BACT|nr:MAG: hypothetical protein COV31_01955 [Candidatus Yanofskybacteria bacterium CG10_big_fil_rev_8_21_14_0_10_46_23]
MDKTSQKTIFEFSRLLPALFKVLFSLQNKNIQANFFQNTSKFISTFIVLEKSFEKSRKVKNNFQTSKLKELVLRIDHLISLLDLLGQITEINPQVRLICIKRLLYFRDLMTTPLFKPKREPPRPNEQVEEIKVLAGEIKGMTRDIFLEIKNSVKPVSNKNLFEKFNSVSKRTVRRHLSELLDKKMIDRSREGRNVHYSV